MIKKGKLAKYLLDHIKRVIISEDYEEMERLIVIHKYLFILKNKNNKNCIERECQEVFLFKRFPGPEGLKQELKIIKSIIIYVNIIKKNIIAKIVNYV